MSEQKPYDQEKPKTREEKHPFAVRLFWIAILVAICGLILGITFGVKINNSNDRISKADTAIQQNDRALTRTNNKFIEDRWHQCRRSRTARLVSINNYKAEKKLYDYIHKLTENGLKAAQIVVHDPKTTPTALAAAKQRVVDDTQLLNIVPRIIIPKPVAPCGPDPHTVNVKGHQ